MQPSGEMLVVESLTPGQTEELHLLFQGEWWSKDRSLEEVRSMLQHSDFVFAWIDPRSRRLLAFARVLTDRVFKALLLDVIVQPDIRGAGLGSRMMRHILEHRVISKVRHVELYCLPEMLAFYRRHGFVSELGELRLMRRAGNPVAPADD